MPAIYYKMHWTPWQLAMVLPEDARRWSACNRKEHEELAQRVAQARSMQEGFAEDLATMAGHAADVRAEREAAEATLSTVRHQFEGSRQDWKRKLHDRRKKVLGRLSQWS